MEWLLDHLAEAYVIGCIAFTMEHPTLEALKERGYRDNLPAHVKAFAPSAVAIFIGTMLVYEAVDFVRNGDLIVAGGCAALSAIFGLASFHIPRYIAAALPVPGVQAGPRRVASYWGVLGLILMAPGAIFMGSDIIGFDYLRMGRLQETIAIACMPAGYTMFALWDRARQPDLQKIIGSDSRPPVLYIRSFTGEELLFTPGLLGLDNSFEEYFRDPIIRRIGPFIGLGNPTDYAPPFGAARAYTDASQWRDRFAELANRAQCIVLPQDDSANLKWELGLIKEGGMADKVFLLAAPALADNEPGIFRRAFSRIGIKVDAKDTDAASSMTEILPFDLVQLPDYKLPAGSVIGFTRRGNAVLLAHGLKEADEYIAIIARRLEEVGVKQVNAV